MVNGKMIRRLREQRGLTTTELGIAVCASQSMIAYVELGAKQPSVTLLKRIADYFGLTMDALMTGATQEVANA